MAAPAAALTTHIRAYREAVRMDWTIQLDAVWATAIAMVLGGLVGVERELKDRPAGFRTHMLVAGAASLLVGIGRLALDDPAVLNGTPSYLRIDPLRLVEAVIAGVAFIGAGTIFGRRDGDTVAGITTAASLLMVAVIGIAAGFHYYVLAGTATVLALTVLTLLDLCDRWLRRNRGAGARRSETRD
jgi:putative Mg2+ transporter-C (MgtC) family protein